MGSPPIKTRVSPKSICSWRSGGVSNRNVARASAGQATGADPSPPAQPCAGSRARRARAPDPGAPRRRCRDAGETVPPAAPEAHRASSPVAACGSSPNPRPPDSAAPPDGCTPNAVAIRRSPQPNALSRSIAATSSGVRMSSPRSSLRCEKHPANSSTKGASSQAEGAPFCLSPAVPFCMSPDRITSITVFRRAKLTP